MEDIIKHDLSIVLNGVKRINIDGPTETKWKDSHWLAGSLEIEFVNNRRLKIPFSSDHFPKPVSGNAGRPDGRPSSIPALLRRPC